MARLVARQLRAQHSIGAQECFYLGREPVPSGIVGKNQVVRAFERHETRVKNRRCKEPPLIERRHHIAPSVQDKGWLVHPLQ